MATAGYACMWPDVNEGMQYDEPPPCPTCPDSGAICVDFNDRSHCGACDQQCAANETCEGRSCVACPGEVCGNSCAGSFDSDPDNCGGCGHSCSDKQECQSGFCITVCGGSGMPPCPATCSDDSDCPEQACIEGQCRTPQSCGALQALHPQAPSGYYYVDWDGTNGSIGFRTYCDMDTDGGGWTRLAHIADGGLALDADSYNLGLGTVIDADYIQPCGYFPGDAILMRVTMGSVVDFFTPASSATLCDMLGSSSLHTWSADAAGPFVAPQYDTTAGRLGGSAVGWPNVGREQLSFWGGDAGGGGCCHLSYSDAASWGRSFTIDVR
jgi:hypothetical protein